MSHTRRGGQFGGALVLLHAEPRARLLFCNADNLIYNVAGQEIPGAQAPRENLGIRLSEGEGEGETWGAQKTIAEATSASLDLALLPDGTVLCFDERRALLTVAPPSSEWLDFPTAQTPESQSGEPSR
jgi:hypothetical protein